MAKHVANAKSLTTTRSEYLALAVANTDYQWCTGVSNIGQTVCTIVHFDKNETNTKHAGFSNVTDQFRTWGKHRA